MENKQLSELSYDVANSCPGVNSYTANNVAVWLIHRGYRKVSGEPPLLTGTEIGDMIDLEKEAGYPRSDGSITYTISVDRLLKAQRDADVRFGQNGGEG